MVRNYIRSAAAFDQANVHGAGADLRIFRQIEFAQTRERGDEFVDG
jgi:hypothetical protein